MFTFLKYETKRLPTIGLLKTITVLYVMTIEAGQKQVRAGAFDSAKVAEFGLEGIASWTAENGYLLDQQDAERIFPELAKPILIPSPDPEYIEDEPQTDEGPAAYHNYLLQTNPDGSISGTSETNDNLDHGVPSEHASWSVEYKDRAAMDKAVGKSRTGCSGVRVNVYLDGEIL